MVHLRLRFWLHEEREPILNCKGWCVRKPRSLTSSLFDLGLEHPAI